MPTMVPRDSALAAVAESSALTTGIDNPIDVAHQTTLCRYFAILIIVTLSESGILHKTAGFPSSHAAADPRAVALYRGQPDSKLRTMICCLVSRVPSVLDANPRKI
jgi:hypothetical protein